MSNDAEHILNEYLSKKLSLDEFDEAMNHPNLDQSHKLEITDAYFNSLGSVDITGHLSGRHQLTLEGPKKNYENFSKKTSTMLKTDLKVSGKERI